MKLKRIFMGLICIFSCLIQPGLAAESEGFLLQLDRPVATVSPRYLSFAIDTTLVVGGHWWSPEGKVDGAVGTHKIPPLNFEHPRLQALTQALAPAYLRIGGSEADRVFYDLENAYETPPGNYELLMKRAQFDALNRFAQETGQKVMFTLNAGPGPRPKDGVWEPENARALIRYSRQQNYAIPVWEFGNEINGFLLIHGFPLSGQDYARDLARVKALLEFEAPGAKLAGPASAYWPLLGEPLGIMRDFLPAGGQFLDILTWHYYPQQSRRCPVATRRAHPRQLLNPHHLDTVSEIQGEIERGWRHYALQAQRWLGETGHAQCGGEPGLSETYASSLWWLDQLGLMARAGQKVQVRQALVGSNYGLLNEGDFEPRPDYWSSLLWKHLMGTHVLAVTQPLKSTLRVYAHCHPKQGVSVLALNLSEKSQTVRLEQFSQTPRQRYLLSAPQLQSPQIYLNGQPLVLNRQGQLPEFQPENQEPSEKDVLPPQSMVFWVFPQVKTGACDTHSPIQG